MAQQQQNFNLNNTSLLAGLNCLQPTSLAGLGSNLGASPAALLQPQGNTGDAQSNFPFLGGLGRLSNTASNPLGVTNLNGSKLNSLLGNTEDSNVNTFHQQQVANALASQQEQHQDATDALDMSSMQPRRSSNPPLSAALQHQHDTANEANHHQQIQNILANSSSEMRSNLLERLQSEESEARILAMILDQQRQKQKDGGSSSNNGNSHHGL